jgi:DNA-binding IclR family transcriptional regulator
MPTTPTRKRSRSVAAPRGVQSATVGLAVLKVLIESDQPLFLREVAAGVGMAPSNVYRYLVSFGQAGMISQDSATGKYDLGPLAIQLGLSALRRVDVIEIAVESLSKLVKNSKADGHVCVWGTAGPTVLRWKEGPSDIAVKVSEGLVLPLVSSATGRVWSAFLPQSVTATMVGREIAKISSATDTDRSAVRKAFDLQLAEVLQSGIARSSGEQRSGIEAVCAPVFDREGTIVLTLTLLGVSEKFDSRLEGTPVSQLRSSVEEITRRIGGGSAVISHYPWSGALTDTSTATTSRRIKK